MTAGSLWWWFSNDHLLLKKLNRTPCFMHFFIWPAGTAKSGFKKTKNENSYSYKFAGTCCVSSWSTKQSWSLVLLQADRGTAVSSHCGSSSDQRLRPRRASSLSLHARSFFFSFSFTCHVRLTAVSAAGTRWHMTGSGWSVGGLGCHFSLFANRRLRFFFCLENENKNGGWRYEVVTPLVNETLPPIQRS